MRTTNTTKANAAKKSKAVPVLAKASEDIVRLIIEDHKPLKQLIKIMKNSDKPLAEREAAFLKFAPLLTIHAKSEEEVLYVFMKKDEELVDEGHEGDVEHGLADQMLSEAKTTADKHLRAARIKVLAELVEHHIKEEEETMLPDFKKNSEKADRLELGALYVQTKHNVKGNGQEIDPGFVPLQ